MGKKDIDIKIPYKLAGKLSKKLKEAGFNTLTSYIIYVLEQVISPNGPEEETYNEEEEKDVRERLKELGYL